jgi:succinate dehydrogenase / fumarate reductase cytochrome b subunit
MQPAKAFSSSVGSKLLIAFTGLALLIFLVAHLAGNLLFLIGPEAFNEYGHKLTSNPLIYGAELGLLAVFVLHVIKTIGLVAKSSAARPDGYSKRKWAKTKNPRSRKSLASSTMIVTGTITLLFIVTHLITFKFGTYYESNVAGVRDLYRLQMGVFSNPLYVGFYIVSMVVILFHLWHGVSSAMQSLGISSPTWTPRILVTGRAIAVILGRGFAILPVYTFIVGMR